MIPNDWSGKRILVIGSGPIQIGQGCEFDYSGTQACLALRDEGCQVILVNSNPATIMTDPESAFRVYIEPLTLESLEKVIEIEKPDAILPTVGGQIALNLFVEMHRLGILEKYDIATLGVRPRSIELTENRREFRNIVTGLGLGVVRGGLVTTKEDARALAENLRFPLVIRASYTLGGSGGGIAGDIQEFESLLDVAFALMPRGSELSIEESIVGWKEYELEVMRDSQGHFIVVCGIENINPMGVHTGDSITVAPCMTLTDREYQTLREMAKKVFEAVGMEVGGANIQFAICPSSGEIVVIEMNPRVSRSSALVSKATGYPIARISAKLALGRHLTELKNEITGFTPAFFEPSIDYVAVKIPRWDFEKYPAASSRLGIQMKSVGEVLAFGSNFKEAFQKAWRSLETGLIGWQSHEGSEKCSLNELRELLRTPTPSLFSQIKQAIYLGLSVEEVHEITMIGKWFLLELQDLVLLEKLIASEKPLSADLLLRAKRSGFTNAQLAELAKVTEQQIAAKLANAGIKPTFKMVDTCAGEFEVSTPYYFKTFETQDENRVSESKKIIILGSGPNRIGQGVEFDYSCVHAVKAVQEAGYEAILVNSNPETVSTDFHTSDKLYIEPLYIEDVLDILTAEKPVGVFVQFGGQSPLKLAKAIELAGFKILGSPFSTIELAENRQEFAKILNALDIKSPPFGTCNRVSEALEIANKIGYPVLVRPSYVLGGRAMQVAYNSNELKQFFETAIKASPNHPLLIDSYLEDAIEYDVDIISDGTDVLIPAVMEQIEEAGIHSGDSACIIPPIKASSEIVDRIINISESLTRQLKIIGLMNIQCILWRNEVYVLEVNPRSSRSVPFVSKATGVPMARIAAAVCLGTKLSKLLSAAPQCLTTPKYFRQYAMKAPVFPFEKFPAVVPKLGPEMRSIGEVMSTANDFNICLAKGYIAAGLNLKRRGICVVVAEPHYAGKLVSIVKTFLTSETAQVYCLNELKPTLRDLAPGNVEAFSDISTLTSATATAISLDQVSLLVVVEQQGKNTFSDFSSVIGPLAIRSHIPYVTSTSAAQAIVNAMLAEVDFDIPNFLQTPQTLTSKISTKQDKRQQPPLEINI